MSNEPYQCWECGAISGSLEELLKEEKVEGQEGLTETFIEPACGHRVHVWFHGLKLKRFLATLEAAEHEHQRAKTKHTLKAWERAKKRYQVEWDVFQAEWREKLGRKSPTAVLNQLNEGHDE